jgi:hypothetical protein
MSKDLVRNGKNQFLLYEAEDGQVKIDVRLEDETGWLTQQLMDDLFQTTKPFGSIGGILLHSRL